MGSIHPAVFGIGFFVLAGLVFFFISRAGERMQAEIAARIAAARPAEADVPAVRTAAMQNASRPRTALLLTLRVHPPGGEPYESVGAWEIDAARVPELQVGRRVPMKVAHDDPQTVFPGLPDVTYEPGNHRIWLDEQARGRAG